MRKIILILAIEFANFPGVAVSACGQAAPTVRQTATHSDCSNIVALSGAKVDCSNLTPDQKKALANIPSILKAALENQGYLEAILKKLEELPQAGQQTTTNYAPNGIANSGTIQGNATVNYGPPPLAMTDVNFAGFKVSARKIVMTKKFIVLLSTNDGDAFDLAKQLCIPAKSLGWSYACPRILGPTVTTDGVSGTEIINAAGIPNLTCFALIGKGRIFIDNQGIVAAGCAAKIGWAEISGTPDEIPEKGITCYSDNWTDPDSVAFMSAMSEGELTCNYIDHPFRMSRTELLSPMSGTQLGGITIVIGRPAQP